MNSIRTGKSDDLPHNLVLHRPIPVNDLEAIYRNQQSLHLRNGIHDSPFRREREAEVSPPHLNNHDAYGTRRMVEYDEEENCMLQQRENMIPRNMAEVRLPEISDVRLSEESTRIMKPAPLQARVLSVVDADVKDAMSRPTFYVIPRNTIENFVLIKKEPPEIQVSVYSFTSYFRT